MTARAAGIALLGLVFAQPAYAQSIARTNQRYDEDWSALSGQADAGWQRLKFLPLDSAGDASITLGIEARARYEGFENPGWGATPDDGYLWLRLMPLADVHVGPARVFVQPIAGYARGVAGGNGPADQTGIDLLQGFGEWRFALGKESALTVRGGRELVALGSERLVGLRYGPNIPQAFDGARATITHKALKVDLLHLRPVQVGQRDFDDRTSDTRQLDAIYATWSAARNVAFDAYVLDYRNSAARFGGAAGVERRSTLGLRAFGREGRFAWNWEAMVQRGHFAGQRIRAWSLATETSVAFPAARLKPRLRLRANYASGDRKAGDGTLGTFNAMFPKGKYFGELSPIGPRNIINLHPGLDISLGKSVSVEIAGVSFWRAALADGVYDVPGQEIRSAGGSTARHIGDQVELSASWKASDTLSFAASLSLFRAGAFLRETGAARPIHMAGLETMLKF
ncbi:alginate export family protein [Novosphingobium sp.]|uniref:alginate export family protein n=1 Tax=Novosphingobium sp. TaxID=1874826 RepID=UPI0038BC74E5